MESKGERRIREILEEAGVLFQLEYAFPQLRSLKGQLLRFDFIIFEEGGTGTRALIEFQGEQHYRFVEHFSKSKPQWDYARMNDYLKCRFSLMSHIPLYCIPYTELPNLRSLQDLLNDKFLVKTKYHMYDS